MRFLIALMIALTVSPTLVSAKDATSPRVGVNVLNRFSGQSFINDVSRIEPISTTLLELTYGNYRRNFYSALRFTTPLTKEDMLSQLSSVNTIYGQTSKLGFSLGGGYGFGKVDPVSGVGSSFMITTAMAFDINIHNEYFKPEDIPGYVAWGLELMLRYNFHFSKYSALVLGFDLGYSLTLYDTGENLHISGIYLGDKMELIHYFTFGGVIGFRF
ncbi:MAG: hypothetical protein ACRCS8_03940 [Brevinema sp.]